MRFSSILSIAAAVSAAPTGFLWQESTNVSTIKVQTTWTDTWKTSFDIHDSCSPVEANQLRQAFEETERLAHHAKLHTLRNGNSSEFYRKYFGNAPIGEVVGNFEGVISANTTGILFRCDDPDENCHQDGWAGYWRGEDHSDETNICPLSFESRLWLSQLCSHNFTVAGSKNSEIFAADILHRLWHTEKLGQNVIGHYADSYEDCLELAKTNESEAVRNSATLRLYALDVYAYDLSVPGEGCTYPDEDATESDSGSASATTVVAACHTHSDGEIHCE
ncbi:hypothetical protein FT663_01750 [Candidozyma haemuli var. vulneris]|uniref:Putative peptidase domain-containing protein n=1 Tax=Candidozyma haemuli TaxID=45357 RepID=A0A2V1ASR3_9ASCO|nr:hypothetical protein CXQ85_002340 [[Candida] haemuloni]KAF3989506.1 hypothetical protein FT662_02775 [[Candida] haemuloni var. vulneris]KAF3993761.1 hypothetical protein FT663_01750 [[Candida] haemuloni var. vulneris]PVH20546.1 hypothetical protein CXQ85_002340 [[Candida] haemuloni]